jgi:4-hydroxymandelate oxidase
VTETKSTPWGTEEQFATVNEIKRAAAGLLAEPVWNFLEGGAGDEWTLHRCESAFKRWEFRPRMLTGIDPPQTATEVLGLSLSMPVITSPFGFDTEFHPSGFPAVARGAERCGTATVVPVVCSTSLESVRAAAPTAARLFQVVAWGAEQPFLDVSNRAADAGYEALVVTVDTSVPGWRERSMEDRWSPQPSVVLGNFADDVSGLMSMMDFDQRMWTWDELGERCRRVGLPWIAKGILCAEDARAAVEVGAAGVFVSNHGGRQLAQAPVPLDVLPDVVAEVGDEAVVIVDGGVRRGSDVLVALALGADLVGVGRPAAWGLAAGGEEGVERVLELLRQELVTTMSLCGRSRIADIDRSLVAPVTW